VDVEVVVDRLHEVLVGTGESEPGSARRQSQRLLQANPQPPANPIYYQK